MERVAIYNRCSTEEESQRNALAAQAMESREIAEKMGWMIIEQYIEAQTGTVACKRSEYQRLLADMEGDRFDIVMIKSIDRLTRSAKDWYFFLSRLTENQLKLYIYIEGKYYTPDDNLISGIKAILAEDFSRELSKKIRNAHRRRQEKKSGLNITCEMFGWDKVDKNIYEINQEEAAYYRTAFRLAKEGKGFYTISNILYELGARARSGQKISAVQWRKMLYTPRAHGTMILNTRTYNFDTKRYEKVPNEQWIYMENALPPIVSKAYQEEVLEVLRIRAAADQDKSCKKMRHTGKYELSHKLVCGTCNNYYYRSGEKGRAVWKCATFLKNGRTRNGENLKGCDNPNIREEQVWCALKKELYKNEEGGEGLLMEFMKMIEKALASGDGKEELKKMEREQKKLVCKSGVLMEKLLTGVISDQEFKRYEEELNKKLEAVNLKINSIKREDQKYNNYECRIQKIKEVIQKEDLMEKAGAKQLLGNIDHILIGRDGSIIPVWKEAQALFCKHL